MSGLMQVWAGYADWHMRGEVPNPTRALSILTNGRQVSISLLMVILALLLSSYYDCALLGR